MKFIYFGALQVGSLISEILIDSMRLSTDLMGMWQFGSKQDYLNHSLVINIQEFAKPMARSPDAKESIKTC